MKSLKKIVVKHINTGCRHIQNESDVGNPSNLQGNSGRERFKDRLKLDSVGGGQAVNGRTNNFRLICRELTDKNQVVRNVVQYWKSKGIDKFKKEGLWNISMSPRKE